LGYWEIWRNLGRDKRKTYVADGVRDVSVLDAANEEVGARVVVFEVEANLVNLVLNDLRHVRSEDGGKKGSSEEDGREFHDVKWV